MEINGTNPLISMNTNVQRIDAPQQSERRQDRINQVRSEIDSGTYNIKAEKIAEKIVGGSLLDEVF